MAAALVLNSLTKRYGDKEVVKGIHLEIREGEILGLLGPNGAGKSTTINMIAGVTKPDAGSVSAFGFDNQKDFIETRRRIGVMHQEIVVDTFFSIDKALKIHSGYYGVKDDPEWRKLLIERLDLGPHLQKSMNRLSGGMKRRFMVAKALIHKPKLLILDEPTAGVDVELRRSLWDFVREMNRTMGTTVLLTTHYLEEAEEMCERIAIMNHGSIVAMDRTSGLLARMDERQLILHLEEAIASVPQALEKYRCELREPTTLCLKISKQLPVLEVLAAVSATGLKIRDIETRSPNLQEAFLQLTARTPVLASGEAHA